MSLITLQRSPSIDNEITNNETKTNHKQQYLEAMRQPSDQLVSLESDSKIESFDKEFNFQDLKEIYATSSLPIKLTHKQVPPPTNKVLKSTSHVRVNNLEDVMNSSMSSVNRQLFEKYFLVKDAALILPRRLKDPRNPSDVCSTKSCSSSSLTATDPAASYKCDSVDSALPMVESQKAKPEQELKQQLASDSTNSLDQSSGDILVHLKSMVQLLRPTDTISVAVKLFSYHAGRARYLVVVETPSCRQPNSTAEVASEESAILGLDLQLNQTSEDSHSESTPGFPSCSVGLVIPIYANCEISLNGDGGFKFKTHQSTHIFKPVSIQAMWSAYQYLNKALENSRKFKFYSVVPISMNSLSSTVNFEMDQANQENSLSSLPVNHQWVKHYTAFIGKNKTELQYLNEWYQKEDRSAQREEFTTPYFDQNCLSKEQEETGIRIKEKLKEIMINSKDDYGSMSSIAIRNILEKELQMNLENFKKFVDVTIFQFYNQLVECASQILPFLYLGTEWNASNYDSLVSDGITHILNVSSDVDNFFPDAFKYLNIRVRDVDETDLLKEFDRTNKFIQEARDSGTACIVHCKMGVSRSASVVLAYLMKEYHYSLESAFNFTKQKRTCINPNDGFRVQLATYESILNAHRAKYSLFEPNQSNGNTNTSSDPAPSIVNGETSLITSDQADTTETACAEKCSLSPDTNKSSSWNNFAGAWTDSLVVESNPAAIEIKDSNLNEIFKETTNELKSSSGNEHTPAVINNVQKLANVYMGKKARSLPTSFSQQMISSSMPKESSRFSLSLIPGHVESGEQSVDELVPLGIVKRQVESINFKLKTSQPDNRISPFDNDFEMTIDNQHRSLDSFQSYNKQQQQQFQTITRSPDSKRFKWESLNAEPAEMKSSKKVFDFLAGKYSQLEREDTERIGNSFYLELQQPVVLKSDCAEANSLLTLDAKSPSSMSNSIILNVKNNEISKYQTV